MPATIARHRHVNQYPAVEAAQAKLTRCDEALGKGRERVKQLEQIATPARIDETIDRLLDGGPADTALPSEQQLERARGIVADLEREHSRLSGELAKARAEAAAEIHAEVMPEFDGLVCDVFRVAGEDLYNVLAAVIAKQAELAARGAPMPAERFVGLLRNQEDQMNFQLPPLQIAKQTIRKYLLSKKKMAPRFAERIDVILRGLSE